MNQELSMIRNASMEDLLDLDSLTRIIYNLGIYDPVNLSDKWSPSQMKYVGRGLMVWQHPEQLAEYLIYLSSLRIRSYLEMGVAVGGTFITTVEFLKRFEPSLSAIAVDDFRFDRIRSRNRNIIDYCQQSEQIKLIQCDTKDLWKHVPQQNFDLVMIDADHSYASVSCDWKNISGHSRMVAFHDIITGRHVRRLWGEIKKDRKSIEFCRLPPDIRSENPKLGIGLLPNRSKML